MLKKAASIVLASLRASTYRSIRLASSLAAALLNSLFEHPADYSGTLTLRIVTATCRTKTDIFCKLLSLTPIVCLVDMVIRLVRFNQIIKTNQTNQNNQLVAL